MLAARGGYTETVKALIEAAPYNIIIALRNKVILYNFYIAAISEIMYKL